MYTCIYICRGITYDVLSGITYASDVQVLRMLTRDRSPRSHMHRGYLRAATRTRTADLRLAEFPSARIRPPLLTLHVYHTVECFGQLPTRFSLIGFGSRL